MKNNLQPAKNGHYEWNPSMRSSIAKQDIKLVMKEIRELEDTYGEITPHLLVEASKKKKSVLHRYFEWDNDLAAEKWRLTQASYLLSGIQVKVVSSGKPLQMRAYQVAKSPGTKKGENAYTRFDALSEDNLVYIQRTILGDLLRAKNKLLANDLTDALPYIEKAIKILQKKAEVIDISSSE